MARPFTHPAPRDFSVDSILYALSDPIRRSIVSKLLSCKSASCSQVCGEVAPSTISFHYKVLRESGLIRSEKKGVEVISTVRKDELDKRFPGLIDSILQHHK